MVFIILKSFKNRLNKKDLSRYHYAIQQLLYIFKILIKQIFFTGSQRPPEMTLDDAHSRLHEGSSEGWRT